MEQCYISLLLFFSLYIHCYLRHDGVDLVHILEVRIPILFNLSSVNIWNHMKNKNKWYYSYAYMYTWCRARGRISLSTLCSAHSQRQLLMIGKFYESNYFFIPDHCEKTQVPIWPANWVLKPSLNSPRSWKAVLWGYL